MKRSMLAFLAVIYMLVAATAWGQSSMENTIRLTYAKATFAAQAGMIEKVFLYQSMTHPNADLNQLVQDNTVTFALSNFKDADVPCSQEPMSKLASSFADKPILTLEPQKNTWKTNDVQDSADTEAVIRESIGQKGEGTDKFVICDLNTLSSHDDPRWSKFTTYDVTATYRGKPVSYHASFVFDINGNAMACDPFVLGLTNLVTADVYPQVLLNHLNTNAAVMKWAENNSVQNRPSQQMSCDLTMLKCLIPASDIINKSESRQAKMKQRPGLVEASFRPRARDLMFDYPENCNRWNNSKQEIFAGSPAVGTGQHQGGDHEVSATYTQQCTYTDGDPILAGTLVEGFDCNTNIAMSENDTPREYGGTFPYYHSPATSTGVNAGKSAIYPNAPTAITQVAGAVDSCGFFFCPTISITYNGTGFSFSPNPYWSRTLQQEGGCQGNLIVVWPE